MNDNTTFLRRSIAKLVLAFSLAGVFLAACDEDDVILPGKRESIRPNIEADVPDELRENEARPIRLPAVQANTSWPQPYGTPEYRTQNPSLSNAPSLLWSTNIGAGDTRRQRVVASPVVGGGLIYTLDSEALLLRHRQMARSSGNVICAPRVTRAVRARAVAWLTMTGGFM